MNENQNPAVGETTEESPNHEPRTRPDEYVGGADISSPIETNDATVEEQFVEKLKEHFVAEVQANPGDNNAKAVITHLTAVQDLLVARRTGKVLTENHSEG